MERKRSAERRAELEAAALHLIREQGFAATSVADITAHAGVAKATFYRHYSSKEALLAELQASVFSELGETIFARIGNESPHSWGALLDAAVAAAVDFLYENAETMHLLLMEVPPLPGTAGESGEERLMREVIAFLAPGQASGDVVDGDIEAIVFLLVHALAGAVDHELVTGNGIGQARLRNATQLTFRRALLVDPAQT